MSKAVIRAAKKTFIAFKNPYGSVEKVYPNIIEAYDNSGKNPVYYVGVKNTSLISPGFIHGLRAGGFYLHTLDKASVSGRAVDIFLQNPYTGRPMTGSSSGTAINVLLGINDIGIGTDGGGSVLAPAISVNLFGFISPLLDAQKMKNNKTRVATDGVQFRPSLGCMSKKIEIVELFARMSLQGFEPKTNLRGARIFCDVLPEIDTKGFGIKKIDLSFKDASREELLKKMPGLLASADVIVSREGPVDFEGMGDTVLGHFDSATAALQKRGNKGFVRVANMAGATALVMPAGDFACAFVLMCESTLPKINKMFGLARKMPAFAQADSAFDKYFSSAEEYFPGNFGDIE